MKSITQSLGKRRYGNPALPGFLRKQRGVTLIEVTLGLIISSLIGYALIKQQVRDAELKRNVVQAEQMLLLKESIDAYSSRFRREIIIPPGNAPAPAGGGAFHIDNDFDPATAQEDDDGIPGVDPLVVVANMSQPTIDELKALNLLDVNFDPNPFIVDGDANADGLNGDAYVIRLIRRQPLGCLPEDCGIEGLVYIGEPLTRNDFGDIDYDGRALGDMLGKLGGNGFATLDNAGLFRGVGSLVYPAPGDGPLPNINVAGLVGVRVGIPSLNSGQFVDLLTQNLTVTQQADIQNLRVENAADFNGLTRTRNIEVYNDVNGNGDFGDDGNPCVRILTTGEVSINCNGLLDATRGQFISDDGQSVLDVSPVNGVRFSDATGVHSQIFNIPGAITVRAGELFVFNSNGTLEAKFEGGNIIARNSVSGTYIAPAKLNVSAGDTCPATSLAQSLSGDIGFNGVTTKYFSNAAGELLYCDQTVLPNRVRTVGVNSVNPQETCPVEGEVVKANRNAVGVQSGEMMICKNGFYFPLKNATSSFVIQEPVLVSDGSSVPKPVCGFLGGSAAGQGAPAIIVVPAIEASDNSSFVRTTTDTGAAWTVNLKRAPTPSESPTGNYPLTGARAIALTYCLY